MSVARWSAGQNYCREANISDVPGAGPDWERCAFENDVRTSRH